MAAGGIFMGGLPNASVCARWFYAAPPFWGAPVLPRFSLPDAPMGHTLVRA